MINDAEAIKEIKKAVDVFLEAIDLNRMHPAIASSAMLNVITILLLEVKCPLPVVEKMFLEFIGKYKNEWSQKYGRD